MHELLSIIADLVYAYGVSGAGIPSWHGIYEGEVPRSLRNCDEKESI